MSVYWVPISDHLLGGEFFERGMREAGLTVVEVGPWRDTWSRMVRIDDPAAPAEMEGAEVDLTFTQVGNGPIHVSGREIIRAAT